MKRSSNAAKDLAALLADASPDVRAANAHVARMLMEAAQLEINAALSLRTAGDPGEGARRRLEGAAPHEHDEQAALFAWAAANEGRYPELALLFAIPNGGHRHPAVAAQLKAEGVRPGVPDVFLPAVRPGPDGRVWGGLFVEMKRADHSNGPTSEQRLWLERLRNAGYMAAVAYGAAEAIAVIENYLRGDA
mgnify:FL=1